MQTGKRGVEAFFDILLCKSDSLQLSCSVSVVSRIVSLLSYFASISTGNLERLAAFIEVTEEAEQD